MFFSEETADSFPTVDNQPEQGQSAPKQRILIGSQRNPDAYRPKPSVPVVDENGVAILDEYPTPTPAEEKPALKTGQVVFDSEIEKQKPQAAKEYQFESQEAERKPCQELVNENYKGANHISAARGGDYAFLYTPNGMKIKVNMKS